mmetsp:Transcript_64838/g.174042  ORF Transcript_64838/g.174042 Transcript_64838/m.174042 type:complete len:247 (-) Transcript_64838:1409-2149(-)
MSMRTSASYCRRSSPWAIVPLSSLTFGADSTGRHTEPKGTGFSKLRFPNVVYSNSTTDRLLSLKPTTSRGCRTLGLAPTGPSFGSDSFGFKSVSVPAQAVLPTPAQHSSSQPSISAITKSPSRPDTFIRPSASRSSRPLPHDMATFARLRPLSRSVAWSNRTLAVTPTRRRTVGEGFVGDGKSERWLAISESCSIGFAGGVLKAQTKRGDDGSLVGLVLPDESRSSTACLTGFRDSLITSEILHID